ncbi:hypothetical protein HAX54_018914 [Datura stramonium]|uniref:F-box protein n=1 Tax=Datura stramonium TaxID=4076 RepID=A0ABS8S3V7_DATST|nr:hypothetical protein [Datura stramonium]
MELNEDIIVNIISRLPVKLAIQWVHQLIPYPEPRNYFSTRCGGGAGLAVDHPTTNSYYKLVTVGMLNKNQGYKFRVFSSEEAGVVWHEFQLRREVVRCTSLVDTQPVYARDCLHWLTSDGNILAFDTKSSTGQATIINRPENMLKLYFKDPMCGVMFNAVLGLARGELTLICAFKKFILIFGYDYVSSNWTVSYTLPIYFSLDVAGRLGCPAFPICFDGEKLFILVRQLAIPPTPAYLYAYDFEMKRYKKAGEVLDNAIFFSWEPTLASVPKTVLPPYTVHSKHFPVITETLDELRCLIANAPRVERDTKKAINKFPCLN